MSSRAWRLLALLLVDVPPPTRFDGGGERDPDYNPAHADESSSDGCVHAGIFACRGVG
jgi:hypothetical protein